MQPACGAVVIRQWRRAFRGKREWSRLCPGTRSVDCDRYVYGADGGCISTSGRDRQLGSAISTEGSFREQV